MRYKKLMIGAAALATIMFYPLEETRTSRYIVGEKSWWGLYHVEITIEGDHRELIPFIFEYAEPGDTLVLEEKIKKSLIGIKYSTSVRQILKKNNRSKIA
jgi:hypothetical protein